MAAKYGGGYRYRSLCNRSTTRQKCISNRPALYGGPLIRSLRNTDLSDRTRKRRYRRSVPETNQRPVLTYVYQAVRGYQGPASPGPPVPIAPVPGTGTAGTAGYWCGYHRRAGTALVPAGTRGTGTRYRSGRYRKKRIPVPGATSNYPRGLARARTTCD
jgi:hypothetical protein